MRVAILDRLPTPYGLVRSGVAPDHQDTKVRGGEGFVKVEREGVDARVSDPCPATPLPQNVTNQFDRLLADPRVTFAGGVDVGGSGGGGACAPVPLPLSAVRSCFDAVILAHGAEGDASLPIPGSHLTGVLSARAFVLWANGHPDADAERVGKAVASARDVVVVGAGNVALDCARLLLRPAADLATTDISRDVLAALDEGAASRRVSIVARRGAPAAAFTAKELREVSRLPGVAVGVAPPGVPPSPDDVDDVAALASSRGRARVYGILAGLPAVSDENEHDDQNTHAPPSRPSLTFRFLRSPTAFLPSPTAPDRVRAVAVDATSVVGGRAVPDASAPPPPPLPADLVLVSVGFRTPPLAGAPFDAAACVVPSGAGGRVNEDAPPPPSLAPLYVTGWARRGPTGIIGTNLADADDVAAAVTADAAGLAAGGPRRGVATLPLPRGAPVSAAGWTAIDDAERSAGAAFGAPRVKLTTWDALMAVARRGG